MSSNLEACPRLVAGILLLPFLFLGPASLGRLGLFPKEEMEKEEEKVLQSCIIAVLFSNIPLFRARHVNLAA
jgi:hypothetical protein